MKVKTSVTLSEDVLKEVDSNTKGAASRSSFIEEAVRSYLLQKRRERRDRSDSAILDEHAERLNEEAADVLGYQVDL